MLTGNWTKESGKRAMNETRPYRLWEAAEGESHEGGQPSVRSVRLVGKPARQGSHRALAACWLLCEEGSALGNGVPGSGDVGALGSE